MPFNEFKTSQQAGEAYGLTGRQRNLFEAANPVSPEPGLVKALDFARINRKATPSEIYLREFVIAPVLMHALSGFQNLTVWSDGFNINIDDRLSGTPDYVVSAAEIPGQMFGPRMLPLLPIAEAKREDYVGGWGQCLAEMVACQRLNQSPETPVWGIVTTGETWQFGRLVGAEFTQHYQSVDLDPLDKLLGILHYIFAECQAIAEQWAAAANPYDQTPSRT